MNRRYPAEISDRVWPRIAFALVVGGALLAFVCALPVAAASVFGFGWMVGWNSDWMYFATWLAGLTWLVSYGTCYGCMSSAIKRGLSSINQYGRMIQRAVLHVALTVAGVLTIYLGTWKVFVSRGWVLDMENPEFIAALASVGVLIAYSIVWSITTSAFEDFASAPNPQPRSSSTQHLNRALEQRKAPRRRRSRSTRSSCPIDPN